MRDTVEAASVVCSVVEHQMPRLRRRQRNPHRFRIAHLADDDHVGRLPHGRAQRGREVGRIDSDLHLLDDARLCGCSYSIGSSIVTMCRASRWLISLTSAASVVVFARARAPPMMTSPRGSLASAPTPAADASSLQSQASSKAAPAPSPPRVRARGAD